MQKIDYWSQACSDLAQKDEKMADLISSHDAMPCKKNGQAFQTLLRAIVGQQISVKAADSVWRRLLEEIPLIEAEKIMQHPEERLRSCGLSRRKVSYIKDLAFHFGSKEYTSTQINRLDDESICRRLTAIRGIGRWSAEMFLIFYLQRPNVWPVDDVGLQKAVQLVYQLNDRPTTKAMVQWGEKWQPWRTVASWYLWRCLDAQPVLY